MQDLRGSQLVGGNFNKNNAVFSLDWDLIIIDEAHEGTQTELGDKVVKLLRKEKTKVLALSGTPFNLLSQYSEDNVYTWDYVMEQKKKTEWDLLHQGDHNPYAELPKMHIFTYDLGEKLKKFVTDEYDTKAFNFREFFRVWSRGPSGKRELPKHAVEGRFVHENLHMSDTIGGWCFFNERFEDDTQEEKKRLEEPRFVCQSATADIFREDGRVLEINSKTGLYPLYIAYSFYKQKMEGMSDDDWEPDECQYFWDEAIRNNVYVICKTPMAKSITIRTLRGFSDTPVNAHYFEDLVNMLIHKPEQFKKRIMKGSYWKKEVRSMVFDAVVGNEAVICGLTPEKARNIKEFAT